MDVEAKLKEENGMVDKKVKTVSDGDEVKREATILENFDFIMKNTPESLFNYV